MELYYKDLISKEASLEKLVDDLMLVVQGADDFVQAAGSGLGAREKEELTSRLYRLKKSCRRLQKGALEGVLAADKLMRRYPYSTAGFAFVFGLLTAHCLNRKR